MPSTWSRPRKQQTLLLLVVLMILLYFIFYEFLKFFIYENIFRMSSIMINGVGYHFILFFQTHLYC